MYSEEYKNYLFYIKDFMVTGILRKSPEQAESFETPITVEEAYKWVKNDIKCLKT